MREPPRTAIRPFAVGGRTDGRFMVPCKYLCGIIAADVTRIVYSVLDGRGCGKPRKLRVTHGCRNFLLLIIHTAGLAIGKSLIGNEQSHQHERQKGAESRAKHCIYAGAEGLFAMIPIVLPCCDIFYPAFKSADR